MNKENLQEHYTESFNEFYTNASIEDLFGFLNSGINDINELSNSGINDNNKNLNIKLIVQILFLNHGINNSKIKDQKYFCHLIEKYSDLNKALDRAEDTGGYGKYRIVYEMEEIERNLNNFGLDNEGNLLKSLRDIRINVKENVKSKLSI